MGWGKSAIDEGLAGLVTRFPRWLSEAWRVASSTTLGRMLLVMTGLSLPAIFFHLLGLELLTVLLQLAVVFVAFCFVTYADVLGLPKEDKTYKWLTGLAALFSIFSVFGIDIFPLFVAGTVVMLVVLYLHITKGFPGMEVIGEDGRRVENNSLLARYARRAANRQVSDGSDSLPAGPPAENAGPVAESAGPQPQPHTDAGPGAQTIAPEPRPSADDYRLETDNFGYVIGLVRFIAREVGPITVNITAPDGTSASLPAGRQAVDWVRSKADEGLWYVSFSLPPAYSHLAEVLEDVYGVKGQIR